MPRHLPLTLNILLLQSSDGTWLGNIIEKSIHFMFYHMNYYTAILVRYQATAGTFHILKALSFQLCFTVWFVYHVDINDDLLW